ncbi:MAG: ATP-dependent DNA helicase [Chloroflexota bacterium]|nr:ATP-dependent DNA helicase [Chloroflexota bacterium]
MSDFLEQLNRRLKRKQAEDVIRGTVESSEVDIEGDIALVFAPAGPVAHLLGDTYRPRRGQALMARLVKRALDGGQHALIEAGTGSGKSFAYLIPLIWTGQRAFISTANKTLQNQLWEKDLPALRRIAPRPFTAALLKGRGNYVCRVKLKELSQQLILPGQGPFGCAQGRLSIGELRERLEQTPSGDVEELRLFGGLRDALTVGRHDCLGQRCPMLSRCYYELARIQAEKADIVVLNHALLAFNIVLDGQIVEPRDVIVIDEAQDFEHYVVGALRLTLEYDQVPAFVNDTVAIGNADDRLRGRTVQANHELFTHLAQSADEKNERRWASPGELPLAGKLAGHVSAICKQLMKRYPPVPGAGEHNEENGRHQTAIEWAGQLADAILSLSRPVPEDEVRYCENSPPFRGGRGERKGPGKRTEARIILCQEPVEVADFLREILWAATKTVVCTSATLTVNQRFDYFRRQIGAPPEGAIQRIIASPFDYPSQSLLYTPHGLYPQYGEGEDGYVQKLAAEVERLVRASRGRAFVLCTSTRRAGQLFETLAPRLPFACYRQGTASREELLDLFRNDASGAVLFATKSFWEGVDVPGEALSLVIIDKLPFAPYRDPVIQHREQRIREAGGNPFTQVMLPEAILALKQGVGRLIRAETDRGVLAILDSRINTKRYGSQVIASLPRARRTLRFEDVAAFFAEE